MNATNRAKITRRGFLTGLGGGVALAAVSSLADADPAPVYAAGEPTVEAWGMLIDLTRCTGCGSCLRACQESNGLASTATVPGSLGKNAYTFLESHPVTAADGAPISLYVKRQCMHCLHPACASACTVAALRKTPAGPVLYDAARCIGCRYCQYACPFGVPTYDWEDPLGLIYKCHFCYARLSAGLRPACAEACPAGALDCGRRDALLAEAHARVTSGPAGYVAHVYGEHEGGGTSMLYLSPVPFAALGFPLLDPEPVPGISEAVMRHTPVVAVTVASALTGLNWVIKRRQAVQAR